MPETSQIRQQKDKEENTLTNIRYVPHLWANLCKVKFCIKSNKSYSFLAELPSNFFPPIHLQHANQDGDWVVTMLDRKKVINIESFFFSNKKNCRTFVCVFVKGKYIFSRWKFYEKWFRIDIDKCGANFYEMIFVRFMENQIKTQNCNGIFHESETKHIHHCVGSAISCDGGALAKHLIMSNVFCNHLIVFKLNYIQLKGKKVFGRA